MDRLPVQIMKMKLQKKANQYIRYGDKVPFLFAYTTIRKPTESFSAEQSVPLEFMNLDLLEKDLEEYTDDPAWKQYYDDWLKKGILEPIESR